MRNSIRPTVILVVEDDEFVRQLVIRNLEAAGFLVRAAGTLAEARTALEALPIALVVLDVRLKGEAGLDLLPALAQCGTRPRLLVTSGALEADLPAGTEFIAKRYRSPGADDPRDGVAQHLVGTR